MRRTRSWILPRSILKADLDSAAVSFFSSAVLSADLSEADFSSDDFFAPSSLESGLSFFSAEAGLSEDFRFFIASIAFSSLRSRAVFSSYSSWR